MRRAHIVTRSCGILALLLLPTVAGLRAGEAQLTTTKHPPLPRHASELWLVPVEAPSTTRAASLYEPLAEAVDAIAKGQNERALTLLNRPALAKSALADYVLYYRAVAQLRLARLPDARADFEALRKRELAGYLRTAAAMGDAEVSVASGDHQRALSIYEALTAEKTVVNDQILLKQAEAARALGDRKKTAESLLRVYYEFPLTDSAIAAGAGLESLRDLIVRQGYKADLGRAAQLYGARRYADARAAFVLLQKEVTGDDRELVELRIAECDYFLQRHQAAADGLRRWLDQGARQAEARFFYLSAVRGLGRNDEFVRLTRDLVRDFPDSSWSEEALNNLGTYYILQNEDEQAATVFAEIFEKFPTGTRAERAAWKAGWWSYKNGEYGDTVRVFEKAAATFPRSDYRPSFLYWSARSHGKLKAGEHAESRMRIVMADYANSYYGRLAAKSMPRYTRASDADEAIPAAARRAASDIAEPPTAGLIRLLLAAELYDDALNELRYVQRTAGTSPVVEATMAWAYHRKGELRRAITLMRRAYPQFLTADQALPRELLQVIFPLTYWDLIRKHSAARGLDPYLVAALIAQESTFDPEIRSVANAWGLMQIVPATGRRLARSLGIRRFSTPMLTNPEMNIRLGTLYFSNLVKQFGGVHFALASYNAGENRVVRWKAERPGLDDDEFIDDIPFPETQNYVKRILGTAEDYRLLYGKGGGRPLPVSSARSGDR